MTDSRGASALRLQLGDRPREALQRLQRIECLHDPPIVELHVLVDHDVAKPGQGQQCLDQIGRYAVHLPQRPHRFRVVLKADTAATGQLARDVYDCL